MEQPTSAIGTIENVSLRQVWEDEARAFTPWLASDEGLSLLGDVLGLELELRAVESRVGDYKADMVADVVDMDDAVVVIENQLSKTDHDHLGKIITYAAGHAARHVVWVAETFSDEHREALDWLNQNSSDIYFFGLQIEVLRIGDSLPAPQFKVVSSPNQWAKTIRSGRSESLSETKLEELRFWEDVKQHAATRKEIQVSLTRKALPQHWYNISIGRSNFKIALTVHSLENRLGCEVFIRGDDAKKGFDLLFEQRGEIEDKMGANLDWQRLEDRIGSRIALYRDGNFEAEAQREELIKWLVDWADKFYRVFSPRIRDLEL